ncbi:MAG: hypothetical protein MUE40_19510 [Anaerolineae bacterium]|jgi:hypothetical protein|nr:hypothetical protein [Anaerolineae bacterium]
MNPVDILLILHQRLEIARSKQNAAGAGELMTIFERLTELSYTLENPDLTRLLVHLTDAARDTLLNEPWRTSLPAVDDIKAACAPAGAAS